MKTRGLSIVAIVVVFVCAAIEVGASEARTLVPPDYQSNARVCLASKGH